jgi:hypothetical protein
VNSLWQAALHGGRASRLVCPACERPFTELASAGAGIDRRIMVCVRCFWVWLSSDLVGSSAALRPPALEDPRALLA